MANNEKEQLYLPPGFRFHPTDAEIIDKYLCRKVANPRFTSIAMGDVDLNKCEPWELPSKFLINLYNFLSYKNFQLFDLVLGSSYLFSFLYGLYT